MFGSKIKKRKLVIMYQCSLVILCHGSFYAFKSFVLPRKVERVPLRIRTDEYIGTLSVVAGIGAVGMHDRRKEYIFKGLLTFILGFYGKLMAEPADHAFGDVQFSIGEFGQEFPAFIDRSVAVIIQKIQESFDTSSVVDIIDHPFRKRSVIGFAGF